VHIVGAVFVWLSEWRGYRRSKARCIKSPARGKGTRSNDRETRPKGGPNMCSGGGLSSIRSFVKPVALN